jgi:hypothetical protein
MKRMSRSLFTRLSCALSLLSELFRFCSGCRPGVGDFGERRRSARPAERASVAGTELNPRPFFIDNRPLFSDQSHDLIPVEQRTQDNPGLFVLKTASFGRRR